MMLKSIISKFFVLLVMLILVGCSKDKTPVEKETTAAVNEVRFETQDGKAIIGSKIQLTVKVLPENASNKKVKWSSNNHAVATVDENGLVTTYKQGLVEVTATSESGNKSAVYRMDVSLLGVTQIVADQNMIVLIGEKDPIIAKTVPEKPHNPNLIWESSDVQIATVDNHGVVNGIKGGKTIITIKSESNPDVKKEVQVSVIGPDELLSNMGLLNTNLTQDNDYVTGTCDLNFGISSLFVRFIGQFEVVVLDGNRNIIKEKSFDLKSMEHFLGGDMTIRGFSFNKTYKPFFEVKYTYKGKEYIKTLEIK